MRDGEIVCLDEQGRTQFRDLLFRCGTARFYAFDLLWLNGEDLLLPLIERKRRLRALVPHGDPYLLYCDHVERDGTALFEQACRHDLEGVVAKRKDGAYLPGTKPIGRRLETGATANGSVAKNCSRGSRIGLAGEV